MGEGTEPFWSFPFTPLNVGRLLFSKAWGRNRILDLEVLHAIQYYDFVTSGYAG